MVSKSMMKRLVALERRMEISKEMLPTVFMSVEDASVPDPFAPRSIEDLSDASITGLRGSISGLRIDRLPGEKIAALKKRASKAQPECRVWWMVYQHETAAAQG